jgi:hypothetical protein
MLRRIFGPVKKKRKRDDTMRIKTDNELIRQKNLINHITAQTLSWFGHLHRVTEDRMVKKGTQVETDVNTTTRETKEQMGR